MLKTLTAALFAAAFTIAPAYAQEMMKCDDASMMKMQSEMDAMSDPAMKDKKDMAMKEMDMAKMAMKDGKMEDCTMHMGEASKQMMKQESAPHSQRNGAWRETLIPASRRAPTPLLPSGAFDGGTLLGQH